MADSHREEIAKLEALYAGNPGGRVFVHLAEAYRKAGEHERARRILDEGLARHTDSASGYVVLGRVLADMQIVDEAEVAFRRVLELDGGNLIALRWLGDLARQSGRSPEAVAHYRDLLSRNPSNEEVRDLVEIVEREVAGGAPAAAADEPEWQEPEPVEQVPEAPAEPLTPLSAAPGRTGDEEPAEVEFGLLEIEALEAESDEPDAVSERGAVVPDAAESAAAPAEDSPVVESYGDEDAEALTELSGLARSDEADPLEIHLLDPAYAGAEEQGDYADDEFIADLMMAAEEAPEPDELDASLDVLDSGSALTLQDGEGPTERAAASEQPAEAEPAGVEESGAPPEDFGGDFTLDPAAELSFGVGSGPADEAAGEEVRAETAPETQAGPFLPAEDETESEPDAPPPLQPHGDELGAAALGADPAEAEPRLVTETMAELYRAQGFHDRAADVYRALLRQRPFDLKLSAKLSEAEADAAEAVAERAASEPQETDDEAAGAVWLRGVGSPWDSGSTDTVESANPYTWTAEPDDQPAGAPISSYLRDLVSWKTAGQRWAEAAPPPPPAAPTQPAASWSPDDEPWAGSPVDDAWGTAEPAQGTDPWGGASASANPWGEPGQAAAGAGAAAESAAPEPAAEPMPENRSPTPEGTAPAAPDPEPADPWLQGTADTAADPWSPVQGMPGATPQPAGWTPAGQEPVAGPPSPPSEEAEAEAEDEDLEMFRSWLQSLKK